MIKCFPITLLFFFIAIPSSFSQYSPLDRCIEDSLGQIMPHASKAQKAHMYLELARIWDTVPQKSFNYIFLALRISMIEKNDTLKARARLLIGDYYTRKRKFYQAQENYLASWKIAQRNFDTWNEMVALGQIGALNSNLDNFPKALEYFQKGLEVAQKKKKTSMQGKFLNLLGEIYQQMGDFKTAHQLYLEAASKYHEVNGNVTDMSVQNNIGSLMMDQKRFDDALAHYNRILKLADTTNGYMMGTLFTRIGHIYAKKNDYSNSLRYNKKALKRRQQVHTSDGVNSSLINIAGDFLMLGKLDSGKFYMDKGLEMARRAGRRNQVENGYRHLYLYYLNCGKYKEALQYYSLYVSENEIINEEKKLGNISILEKNQQIQIIRESQIQLIKQNEIQALNLSNQQFQFIFVQGMTGLAGFLMIAFVFYFIYYFRIRRKLQYMNVHLSNEILERKATEHQTSIREKQYRFLSENSMDFISHLDSENRRTYASPASKAIYGYEPEEILTKNPFELSHPDFHSGAIEALQEIIRSRTAEVFTYKAIKKDGAEFWVETVLNPLFDPKTGAPSGFLSVTRDIQERKLKEFEIMEGTKQKENLLKEIHHRVKNNFAILVSLINMQLAQSKNHELRQSLTNLQLRIRTMALVHEMLYRSKDFENISFPEYLRSLASGIAGTYNRRDIQLTLEADDIRLDIEAAIPLGLIVNEILNNSYMHAFPDSRPGNILISLKYDAAKRLNTLKLEDDGAGIPSSVNIDQCKTMGLQIVQLLCRQIDGTLALINNPGASFTLTF